MNSRFILALAISAGMALVVTGVFYQIAMRGSSSPSPEVESSEVVVATKDLEIGATIEAGDLRMEGWPASKISEGSFTEIDALVGRVPVHRILADEPVIERRLATAGSGVGLSPKVPEGMRAISVRVDDFNGVAGFVYPEAKVDVLVTGTPRTNPDGGRMTKTILGNVRVLSAGEHLTPDASGRPQRVTVVTLLLTPEQAELLTLATAQGPVQLVLRNSNDVEVAKTAGVQEVELFGGRKTENVSRPERRPAPIVMPPPPPPPVQIEVIRGAERSTQSFGPSD